VSEDRSLEQVVGDESEPVPRWLQAAFALRANIGKLVVLPLLAGVVTAGLTFAMKPVFTAKTTFLPPQGQQPSSVSAALASLGNLSNLAGAAGGVGLRSPADQYVALMQSVTVSDRIIDRFKLMEVYGEEFRIKARNSLATTVNISSNRRDNLITVEVNDRNPQRAAEMANQYVEELRRLTGELALTEAQQRRRFFEHQLVQSKQRLTSAQQALLASGINENTLKAEPKAAAESFAKLRAELTAAEVRLQTLRSQLRDTAPEVDQQSSAVAALRQSLATLQRAGTPESNPDYVGKYREFKYQEALFDVFSRQYELARVDESREGLTVQVVDTAQAPELKSKPNRTVITLSATALSFLLVALWAIGGDAWLRWSAHPETAAWLAQWRSAR
jgi:uncharacterized protein involved in exopolysaccharide biosynthesis